MIIKFLLTIVKFIINLLFSIIGAIPSFGTDEIAGHINEYLDLLIDFGLKWTNLFIDLDLCVVLMAISFLTARAKLIYNAVMWVVRKLPFLGIK